MRPLIAKNEIKKKHIIEDNPHFLSDTKFMLSDWIGVSIAQAQSNCFCRETERQATD